MSSCQRDGLTKTNFRSRHRAVVAGRQRGMRAYHCPDCKGYHLTKQGVRTVSIERKTYRLHFEGGAHVDVIAVDERMAVIIASRGQPERIEDITGTETTDEGTAS